LVAVFGPGFGESIAVRVPPEHWIVIDSLGEPRSDPTEIPALELVRTVGESTDAVIMTHPHADHAIGIDRLVMEHVSGPIGCAPLWLDTAEASLEDNDREKQLEAARKNKAQRAIAARWEDDPSTRWELRAGATTRVADAQLTALHPDDHTLKAPPAEPNALSTPLLVEWFDVRLVLGADLLTGYWTAAQAVGGVLTDHALAKVPHHGSTTALDSAWLDVHPGAPHWLLTPFNKGKKLPDFEEDEGLDQMLRNVDEVHLTALGRRPSGAVAANRRMTLAAARPLMRGTTRRGITFSKKSTSRLESSWVAAAFNPDGSISGRLQRGTSAFTVLRG